MGACSSCDAATVVSGVPTVKVVLPDGGLREYSYSVTAACVLGKDARGFFVCDADEMEMERYIGAVGADEELRRGQLYFVLPRSMLKHPLHAEDLKTLAVRASAALVGRCGKGAVAPLVFPAAEADGESTESGKRNRAEKSGRPRRGVGKGAKFPTDLIAIAE